MFMCIQDGTVYADPEKFIPDRWMQGATLEEQAMSALGKIPLNKNGESLNTVKP
jgi:hypothetical protein